jgi:hypothetical protein
MLYPKENITRTAGSGTQGRQEHPNEIPDDIRMKMPLQNRMKILRTDRIISLVSEAEFGIM